MRRWLAILLMLIVPLQLSYAAASAYCQHETGRQAAHFGHHAHVHHDEAGDDQGKGASQSKVDKDCGACHMGGLQLLPQQFELMTVPLPSPHHAPAMGAYRSIDIHLIERPNWTASL